mgnify:CR=1 FL=1
MPQINAPDTTPALHTPAGPGSLHLPEITPSPPAAPQATTETTVPHLEIQMQPSPVGDLGLWISLFAIALGVFLGFSYRRSMKREAATAKINALNERIKQKRPR